MPLPFTTTLDAQGGMPLSFPAQLVPWRPREAHGVATRGARTASCSQGDDGLQQLVG